ncbi:MAG: YifB family Mg chelatase-like AAA ATPase [Patescibacteria group bacterium]
MSSHIYAGQVSGLTADIIDIEVDLSRGLRSHTIVGLPDNAVRESKERITAALKNSGFPSIQKGNKKILVSLAPADIRKEGPVFDLGIALAHLLAFDELDFDPEGKLFIGELALSGALRPIHGSLLIAQKAHKKGFTDLFLPEENAREAALIEGIRVYPVRHLHELITHLSPEGKKITPVASTNTSVRLSPPSVDFEDIQGQPTAKRGLEIAAAGGHNIAMSGPPGTGKTLLAKAFIGILPPLRADEILEVTGIHSAAGTLEDEYIAEAPLRTPHHSASYVSLVGGGSGPKPGEITLAHRGVLFLDEFPEFERRVIEALRQPLEDKVISVSRARQTVRFPANCILIATMNPCPCGKRSTKGSACVCTGAELSRYERKLSGPIVDRIDMWVSVGRVDAETLGRGAKSGEATAEIAKRVAKAREIQRARFISAKQVRTNSDMGVRDLGLHARLGDAERELLTHAANKLELSARSYHRLIKLARTIADLEGAPTIKTAHILEAIEYRPKTLS